jgi:hypothetical protein
MNYDPLTGMPMPAPNLDTFDQRFPQAGASAADAYRMGGLADMAGYDEASPAQVFGAYDKLQRDASARAADPNLLPNFTLTEAGLEDPTGGAPLSTSQDVGYNVAKMFAPTSPSDFALYALGGPFSKGVKAGALALGGLFDSDTAEAGGGNVVRRGAKALREATKLGELAGVENYVPSFAAGVGGPSYLSPADQALFASRYPRAGKFVDRPKDSGVGTYRSKEFTAEEDRLSAAREKVMADMKQGYTPYFDPAQRSNVDYNEYVRLFGQPADTAGLTKKIMKGEPPQLDMGALDEAYKTGASLGEGPFGFYKMAQLERAFIDRYGPDEGRRQFVARFSTPMAATTAGVAPTQNLLLAQYGNFMREAGKPLPAVKGEGYKVPYPVGGGKYGPIGNLQQYEKAANSGLDFKVNPKRYDFDWAFRGRRDAPVIDEQMMKGMTGEPQGAEAAKGGYGYYSKPVSERAAALGVDPIQYQEVAWAGLKNQAEVAAGLKRQAFQGQPMITDVNDAIERTSRLLQIPPAEVVRRGLVEAKLPVYSLPAGLGLGAGAMGSLAAQDRYDEGSL